MQHTVPRNVSRHYRNALHCCLHRQWMGSVDSMDRVGMCHYPELMTTNDRWDVEQMADQKLYLLAQLKYKNITICDSFWRSGDLALRAFSTLESDQSTCTDKACYWDKFSLGFSLFGVFGDNHKSTNSTSLILFTAAAIQSASSI